MCRNGSGAGRRQRRLLRSRWCLDPEPGGRGAGERGRSAAATGVDADYYHSEFGVIDDNPEWSQPVSDAKYLNKLRVSWNSGLTDHSLHGPLWGEIYRRLPLRVLVRFPRAFTPPDTRRTQSVSCRFRQNYPRSTIAYQRRKSPTRWRPHRHAEARPSQIFQ